jgi:hypothetical protein
MPPTRPVLLNITKSAVRSVQLNHPPKATYVTATTSFPTLSPILVSRRNSLRPAQSLFQRQYTARAMSTEKKGITEWASKDDGAFKRQVSSFRDEIKEGGKFSPEKGECGSGSEMEGSYAGREV